MLTLQFDFHGMPVVVRADEEDWLAYFADYFSAYQPIRTNRVITGALLLDLRRVKQRKLLPKRKVELVAQTGLVSLHRGTAKPESLWLCAGETIFEIYPQVGLAVGHLDDVALSMPPILTNTYSLFALLLLLRWRSLYHVHAAAALLPDGRSCWITGAQRSGKSTLVTALGLAGWKPIGDDSLFLSLKDGQPVWVPMRKAFHLGNDVLASWQTHLAGIPRQLRYFDRQCIAALEFFQTPELARQDYETVDIVLFPQRQESGKTQIKPLAASEALRRVAEQSTFFALWREQTAKQWQTLLKVTATARYYEVMTGEDVLNEPERVAAEISAAI